MIKNIQDISTVKHCCLATSRLLKINDFSNPNQAMNLWKKRHGRDMSAKLYSAQQPNTERPFTFTSLNQLEVPFEGSVDTYYFGPLKTSLWLAIKGEDESKIAANDLSKVLGISPELLEKISDSELYLLAEVFSDCALFVFTYVIYKFNLLTKYKNISSTKLKSFTTSFDKYFCLTGVFGALSLYGLDRNIIIDLICNDSWYKSKDRPEKRSYPKSETLIITKEDGQKETLGNYAFSIFEESRYNEKCNLNSDEFYEINVSSIKIEWEDAENWDIFGTVD